MGELLRLLAITLVVAGIFFCLARARFKQTSGRWWYNAAIGLWLLLILLVFG